MAGGDRHAALTRLLAAYQSERDAFHGCVTNLAGKYDDDECRQAVAEMDEIIADARAALEGGA